jgi:hypothetical protein
MATIARSLAKYSAGQFAYNNLWTIGDDDGSNVQTAVFDHCVKIMRLFGQRWLAHIYGPAGTVGEEHSFLGSPPLPGYPSHSTWPGFRTWCAELLKHMKQVSDLLPWANILMIFPTETMYGLANHRADTLAAKIFELLLYLTDHHFHVDVLSSTIAAAGKWRGERFLVRGHSYDVILLPFADTMADRLYKKIRQQAKRCYPLFSTPVRNHLGETIDWPDARMYDIDSLGQALAGSEQWQPVQAPADCWVSLTPGPDGDWISLAPARYGLPYSGQVRYKGKTVSIQNRSDFTRLFFPHLGEPFAD